MDNNELLYEFLKRVSANGEMIIEYCRECSSLKKAHKYMDIVKKYYDYKNLFFSSGIKDPTKNRSKANIGSINRITIDIDFRKQYKSKYGEDISDEDIIQIGIDLGEMLKIDYPNDYGQWNFIVFSGNGIHIHYIGNVYKIQSEIDYELFRESTLDFYKSYNKIVGDETMFADEKVGDLGHLFRLPGTINEKEGVKHECKIIAYQNKDSDIVNNMELLFKLADERIKKKQAMWKISNTLREKKQYENGVNPYEWINTNVNVADVIQILIPERKLKPDGKNFYNPAKGSNVNASYFVDVRNNILIRNGSSKLPGTKEGLNCINLVKEWFGFSGKETIEWFIKNGLVSSDILDK